MVELNEDAHAEKGTTPSPTTHTERTATRTDLDVEDGPPPINFDPWKEKKKGIIIYWGLIIFCNVVIPCLVFYPVKGLGENVTTKDAIGIGSASLGISATLEFPLRAWTLYKRKDEVGPLGDQPWWHFDSFMWFYTLAMLVAAIPLAVAPATNPPLVTFFLMFPALLIGELGLNMVPTLFNFKTVTWISSDPPGTRIKPAVFYYTEDICAVDAGKGRQFRREWNARYNASPPFRALMYQLTVFWSAGCFLFVGLTAAVTFTTSLDFAFAYVLVQIFVWGGLWFFLTWMYAKYSLDREYAWWKKNRGSRATSLETQA